jgi:hypothetical protein
LLARLLERVALSMQGLYVSMCSTYVKADGVERVLPVNFLRLYPTPRNLDPRELLTGIVHFASR